jgi:protein-S-isoprenylcysteine O-methyltransferase Ste14
VWCVADFITRGRGTPNPYDAPTRLVVNGLYRLVRNPMYVGLGAVIAGQAALFGSPILAAYGAAALAAFHLRVVLYEEPTLSRTFAASWADYAARVPRWLPRLRS